MVTVYNPEKGKINVMVRFQSIIGTINTCINTSGRVKKLIKVVTMNFMVINNFQTRLKN